MVTDDIMVDPATDPLPKYLASLARQALTFAAAYALGKGWIPPGTEAYVVTGGMAFASVAWGIFSAYRQNELLKRAIAAPAGEY